MTLDGAISDGVVGSVDVSLLVNSGEPNAATFTFTLSLVDPCEADATVTMTQPSDWPTEIWITDAVIFAIDPTTELSHVTSPAGADCGPYTVEFALADSDGVAANAIYYDLTTADQITVDFDFNTAQAKSWTISVTAYLTNYADIEGTNDADSFNFSFLAKDPCADTDATTITIDTAATAAVWNTQVPVSIYTAETFGFLLSSWASSTTTGPTNTPNCGALVASFSLSSDETPLTVSGNDATVDFAGNTASVGSWSLTVEVQATGYTTASDPAGTYTFTFTAFDPCDDADALTINSAYLTSLEATYDLFSGPDSYTWAASSVASASNAEITDANCGAMVVTLAYSSGPSDMYKTTGADSYDLWGSDPA